MDITDKRGQEGHIIKVYMNLIFEAYIHIDMRTCVCVCVCVCFTFPYDIYIHVCTLRIFHFMTFFYKKERKKKRRKLVCVHFVILYVNFRKFY